MNWRKFVFGYLPAFDTLLGLFTGRILFTAIVLSVLITLIMHVRKKLSPDVRSLLWGLCIPALFIPFERSAVIITQNLNMPGLVFDSIAYNVFRLIMSYLWHLIWLAGFILFSVKTRMERKNTIRLLQARQINGCAAYCYKGRSHIYTPQDFETTYTSSEREMLIAHEKQHIIQHDPLLYRFLQTMQCIFWFNPLIHKAVCLIRQDRELLCDERVILNFSKQEYGVLLLSEAKKALSCHAIAGIVSEPGGVYERVSACVKPFSGNKKSAVIVAGIAAVMFAAGLIGFAKPIVRSPMEIRVFLKDDKSFSHIEGTEKFVLLGQDGIALDQKGLFEYTSSIGLKPEQLLDVCVTEGERPTLTSCYTVAGGGMFAISELESEDIFFPYYDTGFNPWSILFKLL